MGKKKKASASSQPSKTAAVIEYFEQNPKAGNIEAAEELKKQYGWHITPGYVSSIKSQKGLAKGPSRKKKATTSTAAKKTTRAATGRSGGISYDTLVEAKRLADHIGGISQAKKALEALGQLQD